MGGGAARRRARRIRHLADRATPHHVSPPARESDARAAVGTRALHRGRGRAGRRGNGRTRSRAAPQRLRYSYSIDDAAEWVTVVLKSHLARPHAHEAVHADAAVWPRGVGEL